MRRNFKLITRYLLISILTVFFAANAYPANEKLKELYPIINQENLLVNLFSQPPDNLKDILMSTTYSTNMRQTNRMFHNLLSLYGKGSTVVDDLIKLFAVVVAKGEQVPGIMQHNLEKEIVKNIQKNIPLKIIDCQTVEEYKKNILSNKLVGGVYFPDHDRKVLAMHILCGHDPKKRAMTFVHELTHAVLDFLFQNDTAPYSDTDSVAEKEYDVAIKGVLENVSTRLGLDINGFANNEEIIDFIKKESVLDLLYFLANHRKEAWSHEFDDIDDWSSECSRWEDVFDLEDSLKPRKLDNNLQRKIKNKYFAGKEFRVDVANRFLHTRIKDLTGQNLKLLYIVAMLMFDENYAGKKSFYREAIAYALGSFSLPSSERPEAEEFFAPIIKYWNNNIHKYAQKIFIMEGSIFAR